MGEPQDFLTLVRLLRDKLTPEGLALLEQESRLPAPEEYDPAIRKVLLRVGRLEEEVARNTARVEERYGDLGDQPPGQQALLLQNSPPPMLMALVHDLIRRSYADRLGPVERSLRLANLAAEGASIVARSGRVSPELAADLQAEAWVYLGNARRVNSNLRGAEDAFEKAESFLKAGSGRRDLKADLLDLMASLRFGQGRPEEAAELHRREIALRRVLNDKEKLGAALINRGIVSLWFLPIPEAGKIIYQGLPDTCDTTLMTLALIALGEALAREGHGLLAWQAISRGETATLLTGDTRLDRHLRWGRGLAYRALGEFDHAERDLLYAKEGFEQQDQVFRSALASLDLASVYVSLGRLGELRELAEHAYTVFRREGLERRALAAFLVFYRAVQSEQITDKLAVSVANYVVRSQHNKKLRFEPPAE